MAEGECAAEERTDRDERFQPSVWFGERLSGSAQTEEDGVSFAAVSDALRRGKRTYIPVCMEIKQDHAL